MTRAINLDVTPTPARRRVDGELGPPRPDRIPAVAVNWDSSCSDDVRSGAILLFGSTRSDGCYSPSALLGTFGPIKLCPSHRGYSHSAHNDGGNRIADLIASSTPNA